MSFDTDPFQNNNSSRSLWKYVLLIILLVLLFASNPSLEDHRNAVSSKINRLLRKEVSTKDTTGGPWEKAGTELGLMLGSAIINKITEEAVQRKNYLFFSLTSFELDGDEKIIGLGIFGNVFISDEIDKKFEDARDKLNSSLNGRDTNNTSPGQTEYSQTSPAPDNTPTDRAENSSLQDTSSSVSTQTESDEQPDENSPTKYYVNASESNHVHFYSTPDFSARRNAYFAEEDTVSVLKLKNGFAYIEFTNVNNQTSKGWVPLNDLTQAE